MSSEPTRKFEGSIAYRKGVCDERKRVAEVIQNCLPDLKSLLRDFKADGTGRGQWVLARLGELERQEVFEVYGDA